MFYLKPHKTFFTLFFMFCFIVNSYPQKEEKIQWINFEQLEDSLRLKPKKVFIHFYADWCSPCLKMDNIAFKNKEIIQKMNTSYYAVKFDIETNDTIVFGGQTYKNKNFKRTNPIHEIPLLMASRKNKPFSLPAIILFDEKFVATNRYFQYLNSEQLFSILKKE